MFFIVENDIFFYYLQSSIRWEEREKRFIEILMTKTPGNEKFFSKFLLHKWSFSRFFKSVKAVWVLSYQFSCENSHINKRFPSMYNWARCNWKKWWQAHFRPYPPLSFFKILHIFSLTRRFFLLFSFRFVCSIKYPSIHRWILHFPYIISHFIRWIFFFNIL